MVQKEPGNGSADLLNPGNTPKEDDQWLVYETNDNNCVKIKCYVKKKEDGNLDFIEHILKDGETIMDILNKYYINIADSNEKWAIYNVLVRVNKDKRRIDITGFTSNGVGGDYPIEGVDELPNTKKRICISRTIKYAKGTEEKVVEAGG